MMSVRNYSKNERDIEKALIKGEYVDVDQSFFKEIAQAIEMRKRDAILNIRVNGNDLKKIKENAKRLGVKYQTFVSELLHRVAVG